MHDAHELFLKASDIVQARSDAVDLFENRIAIATFGKSSLELRASRSQSFLGCKLGRDLHVGAADIVVEFLPGALYLGKVPESEHGLRRLQPGIVDVILYFDIDTRQTEEATQDVAQHCIADVADMPLLIWIHRCMLDHRAHRADVRSASVELAGIANGLHDVRHKHLILEVKVDVAASRRIDTFDEAITAGPELPGNSLRYLRWRLSAVTSEPERCVRRALTKSAFGRSTELNYVWFDTCKLQKLQDFAIKVGQGIVGHGKKIPGMGMAQYSWYNRQHL